MSDYDHSIRHGEVFADITADPIFKKIFGTKKYEEACKGLLKSFFPQLDIREITYLDKEIPGESISDRDSIVDVVCHTGDGRKILIEMQNTRQEYFLDRVVYYSSLLITNQARLGDWDYHIDEVYTLSFINFRPVKSDPDGHMEQRHYVCRELSSDHKLSASPEYIFLNLWDFKKTDKEVHTYPEKWLYLLKNAPFFKQIPDILKGDDAFGAALDGAKRAKFTREENSTYERYMMNARDIVNAKRFAAKEGREEGRAEGREEGFAEGRAEGLAKGMAEGMAKGMAEGLMEVARKMKERGMSVGEITDITGLSDEQIMKYQLDT